MPETLRAYAYLARLDRPIGVWLLLWPGLWGIALAVGGVTQINARILILMGLFTIGAALMRAAGCVINDLWDRDLDKKVARTRVRPLPSGAVSVRGAIIFLAALLSGGMVILLQLNPLAIGLGFAVLPLIIAYPLMKRITWWPQLFLGLTFNFSALMGWAAVTGELHPAAFLLYVSAIIWTVGYDTIYAAQDIEDDLMAGIKSTAIKFGSKAKIYVAWLYAAMMIILLKSFMMAGAGMIAYAALLTAAMHLYFQVKNWAPDNPASALYAFKSNFITGLLIFLAILAI